MRSLRRGLEVSLAYTTLGIPTMVYMPPYPPWYMPPYYPFVGGTGHVQGVPGMYRVCTGVYRVCKCALLAGLSTGRGLLS